MKKRMLKILVCVLILTMVTACSKNIEQQVAEQLELGQKYLAELDYEQAKVAFRKVIYLEPKHMDAYLGLADAYVGMNDDAGALSTLETAYQIISDSYDSEDNLFSSAAGVLERLTTMYTERGETDKAEEVAEFAELFGMSIKDAGKTTSGGAEAGETEEELEKSNIPPYEIVRDEGDRHGYNVEFYFERPVFNEVNSGYKLINELFEEKSREFFSDSFLNYENRGEDSFWDLVEEYPNLDEYPLEYYVSAEVTYQSKDLVSISLFHMEWYGGSDMFWKESFVFNPDTGERVKLTDLVDGTEVEIKDMIEQAVLAQYGVNDESSYNVMHNHITECALDDFDFYLQNDEIHITFPKYSIGYIEIVDVVLPVEFRLQKESEDKLVLAKEIQYDADGSEWYRIDYEYDEAGNLVRVSGYNVPRTSGNLDIRYEYDNSGNKIKMTDYSDPELEQWEEYEYDDSGNMVKHILSNDVWTEYEYNADENLIKETTHNKDGSEYYYCEYDYDSKGNLINELEYSDGNISWRREYGYDDNGNQTKLTEFSKDGSIWVLKESEYDNAGNKVKEIINYPDFDIESGVTDYQYDSAGNVIESVDYDINGNKLGTMKYVYDYDGNMIKKTSYSEDGSLYYRREYQYEYLSEVLQNEN